MRVLLISANSETINMVPLPLGLNCVAVATRNAGHEVELVDLMGEEDSSSIIGDGVGRLKPDVIGISVRNVDDQRMEEPRFLIKPVRDAIATCRRVSGAPIVLGGAGFSIFPEAVLQYLGADMGICGEGEISFPTLLDRIHKGAGVSEIPGLRAPGLPARGPIRVARNLDALPLPDPSLWASTPGAGEKIWAPVQARRGCPMMCSYCSTPALEGTAIRTRSPEAVARGIERHVQAGFDRFYFVDNVFNLPVGYAKDLCAALKRIGPRIRWRCILYPGNVDEALVEAMAESGCIEASLGFESGSERILRNMNKKYGPAEVRSAAGLLARHGIRRTGFVMLGGPGETRESALESLAFADSLNLELVRLTVGIRIYPGTALARFAAEEGIISSEDDLLFPRFYMARAIRDWICETAREWIAGRPNWIT